MTVRYEDSTQDRTIYVALDLGRRRWMVGVLLPGDRQARLFQLSGGNGQGLLRLIESQRAKLEDGPVRVVCCYEAGRDGFWLHRFLCQHGIENRVLDPSSIEVPRRRRRAKTDKLDTIGLLRVLLRLERGEAELMQPLHPPTPALEDARRRSRERERLVVERTGHRNRILGLLATQGVSGIAVGKRDWLERLATARSGDGLPLGPALLTEIGREAERLELVERQLAALAAESRQALAADTPLARDTCQLMRLKGIGVNFASGLVLEAFWRDFHNRRQVGGSFGLVAWPWASGELEREQPISKAGNRRARRLAIECAWMWLIHQPDSTLSRWWRQRFGSGSRRLRKIGIVALARKLMVALWRFLRQGLVPEGAIVS